MAKLGLYASMVSVIASVLIYIVLDDSQLAIYVGLWAPTLILYSCLLYTSPSPRDRQKSRMPSSA